MYSSAVNAPLLRSLPLFLLVACASKTAPDVKAADRLFDEHDANKDGKLDATELLATFKEIGVSWGAERVKYLLAALDQGSGVGQAVRKLAMLA